MGGKGACQEEEGDAVEAEPSTGGQKSANAVAIAAPERVENDVMAKVEATMEKLKVENLPSRGALVAERKAHARALMYSIRLQRD